MDKKRTPTIKDVAKLAGVGMATVSRVINANGYVREDTRAKVIDAINDLEFRPSFIASGMRSNKLRSIGVMVSDITNPIFAAIIQKSQEILLKSNYQLFLGVTNDDPKLEKQLLQTFAHQGVSGIMATLSDDASKAIARTIEALEIPVVLLNRELAHCSANVVANDQGPGCREAIDYLKLNGHTRIGVMITPETTLAGRERIKAIRNSLQDNGLSLESELTMSIGHSVASGYEAMKSLMQLDCPPTAILVASNKALVGALDYLRAQKIEYPDDISIIAFDDTDVSRLLSPPITIVNRDLEALTTEAVNLLLERISCPSPITTKKLLPTWLEKRQSVKMLKK